MNLTDINEIKTLLSDHGFRFSKSLGQNFLTAAWVPEDIAAASGADEKTGVLEIGPGIGCLTKELSKKAARVVAVELDCALKPILRETLSECNNVEVVFGDVLKTDLKALTEEKFAGLRPIVCANLPYNVTSPVLTQLITSGLFDSITVMIQREVAKRICAIPNTADYGAFTLLCQWYTQTQLLFDVPPSCFVPQPKVISSVIMLRKRQSAPVQVMDEELLFRIIRASFNQRRKTLVNALSSGLSFEKNFVENAIQKCGFDVRIRGETLDIEQFAQISDEISGNL